jgi:Flp pilus assembly protein TadD
MEHLEHGTDVERARILGELAARAEEDGAELETINVYGLGLATAGRHSDAVRVWGALLEANPENSVLRVNMAVSLGQLGHRQLARYHLTHVAEHGATAEDRDLGRGQLDVFDRFSADGEDDARLLELQLAAFRQRRGEGRMVEQDRLTFARRLLAQSYRDPDGWLLAEAQALLEEGREQAPDSVAVIELLTFCYLRHDPEGRLDGVIARLEQLAPFSPVLEVLSGDLDEYPDRPASSQRVDELMAQVRSGDPELSNVAIADLASIVATHPGNADHRSAFAFALALSSRWDEARLQAERAGREAGASHTVHFNVAQILWAAGDKAAGRHHLELARQFASSEGDLEDVAFIADQWRADG